MEESSGEVGTIRDTLMCAMFRVWQAWGEHVSSIVMRLTLWLKQAILADTPFGFPTQPTLVLASSDVGGTCAGVSGDPFQHRPRKRCVVIQSSIPHGLGVDMGTSGADL